jgi:hypothetical protein
MRSGDFSQTSSPIYDPASVHFQNGVPVRTPFPGNIIPFAAQDPAGRRILDFYPRPNAPHPPGANPWVQT